ncbi:MAG: putative periplasmic [Rhodospirillaceae bacterium]|nr:MAG: putative periplasmic [Rhodospirillaceae bacterium]TNC97205.1 MAG: putative periplasmic lipoprotein [Stygiobacter sp.]
MRFRLTLIVGLLTASGPAWAAPDYAGILAAGADGPMLAGYRAFQARATTLEQDVQSLCAAPIPASVETARAGFHAAMDSWQKVQWIGYGPVEAFHRGQRVQFWPDKKNAGDRQMLALLKERNAEALEGNRIAFASVAIQGLPALEMLLFDTNQSAKLVEASDDDATLRCRLAQGIAANLTRIGGELVHDWSKPDGFATVLKSAGTGVNPYADARQAASQMFNALHAQLSAMAEIKLAYPLAASASEARPSRAESWRSRRSLRNVVLNLDSLRETFAIGFAPALRADGKGAAADRFLAALTEAQTAAGKLSAPMEEAMSETEGWTRLNGLKAKIKNAAQVLETEVAAALDLQVGFNGLDGD